MNYVLVYLVHYIFLSESPCTNPYSNCSEGWGNYCFNQDEFSSPLCLNYYTNSYIPSSNPNNPNLLLMIVSLWFTENLSKYICTSR